MTDYSTAFLRKEMERSKPPDDDALAKGLTRTRGGFASSLANMARAEWPFDFDHSLRWHRQKDADLISINVAAVDSGMGGALAEPSG